MHTSASYSLAIRCAGAGRSERDTWQKQSMCHTMKHPSATDHPFRLGLCCQFVAEPITFRNTTVKHTATLPRPRQLEKLAGLCRENADALCKALTYCHEHSIGDFRVNSQILPLKSHKDLGYDMGELPDGKDIVHAFKACGQYAKSKQLRLSLHPDQFILLSSPDEGITRRSLAELIYHAEIAEWIGADVINIHGGGAYGDKASALARIQRRLEKLPTNLRQRLTLENDDRTYTPADLLPICRATGIPLTYDVHHHRCLPDGQSVEDTTTAALETWQREPMFHISSPRDGWQAAAPRQHHDFIDPTDFPDCWQSLDRQVTIEVEAKAKEKAVLALQKSLLAG